jgi:hypothetical protein
MSSEALPAIFDQLLAVSPGLSWLISDPSQW